jgi:lysophospholipase L1-like esterase
VIKPLKTIERLRTVDSATIVAIGDSLTYGWMVRKGYLDFLKEMLTEKYPKNGFRLINKGIPGDTAEGGLHRLDPDVFFYKPDCVLVQFALNDAFVGYTPDDYRLNIETIISEILGNTEAEIVLVTSSYIGENEWNEVIEKSFYGSLENLAQTYELSVAPVHEHWKRRVREGVDLGELVQFDGVHPTVMGYKLMAEAVMEIFV